MFTVIARWSGGNGALYDGVYYHHEKSGKEWDDSAYRKVLISTAQAELLQEMADINTPEYEAVVLDEEELRQARQRFDIEYKKRWNNEYLQNLDDDAIYNLHLLHDSDIWKALHEVGK